VIGIGVKNSSSDLLIANCDEFIYYDDLVRERAQTKKTGTRSPPTKPRERSKAKPKTAGAAQPPAASPPADSPELEALKAEALELVLDTVDALFRERDTVWGSMVKQTLKRKRPSFSETFHGYRSFNELLEDAQARGQLELEKDPKSGGYVIAGFGPKA